jgi:glycerophosphoryl diester phosphodiesterase
MARLRPQPPFAAVGPGPLVIAHRGGSLEAPENTLASIRHGVAVGSDWQEIDVTLSVDEHVVVLHDDTLERTTDGQGEVERMTLAQLTALHAGRPRWSESASSRLRKLGVTPPDFGARFAAERVPTLEAALAVPGARLMIELKKCAHPAKLAAKVIGAVERAGATGRVVLGSLEAELVEAVHGFDPSLPLVGIVETSAELQPMLEFPLSVLAVNQPLVEEAAHELAPGVALWSWTAATIDEAEELWQRGVDGIITDAPEALLRHLRPADGP